MPPVRILVVEDEPKLAQVVASALDADHYDVVVAPTGEDGFFRANAEVFDLVVRTSCCPAETASRFFRPCGSGGSQRRC
jgi:DNA-binding response OmpR family regulator